MSEERRSDSVNKTSDPDIHEKGLHQDIVSAITLPSLSLPHAPRRMPRLKRCMHPGQISRGSPLAQGP